MPLLDRHGEGCRGMETWTRCPPCLDVFLKVGMDDCPVCASTRSGFPLGTADHDPKQCYMHPCVVKAMSFLSPQKKENKDERTFATAATTCVHASTHACFFRTSQTPSLNVKCVLYCRSYAVFFCCCYRPLPFSCSF